ncbi:MAG: 2-amino-4-hydroxy-6-hydroxymethyldihydropteridine diphosphokinase [Saprospiraceae bacterium]|nr:2-amino-4-hydroxy-6-hydroxymethyldihydropteridine diphosphokinase [Saprospiraceae bacterium]
MKSKKVYLLLGTNLGNKTKNLKTAIENLKKQLGPIVKSSHMYVSPPWGVSEIQEDYYNIAICLTTNKNPNQALERIQFIEKSMGRVRNKPNESRIIDIDILLWESKIIQEKGLEVPHPRLQLRKFALQPLAEIAPEIIHPVYKLRIEELLSKCEDQSEARRINEE